MESFILEKFYRYNEKPPRKLEAIDIIFSDWIINFNIESELVGVRKHVKDKVIDKMLKLEAATNDNT